ARGYVRMAPALLATWLIAGAPPGPGIREIFLAALSSVFVVSAAARSRGLGRGRSALMLGLERAYSHSVNVLLFLLLLFLAAGLGATLGGLIADAVGRATSVGQVLMAALAMLPLVWWHWPVLALACVAPPEAGARRPLTPWLWAGPGYTAARRLQRAFGSARRTGLITGLLFLWIAVLASVHQYGGSGPLPAVAEAGSYGVFLPVLAWMATVEAARLVASVPGATATAAATDAGPGRSADPAPTP
ncbi:MAG: hypothetical protein GWM90_26000, partial [Gemmatimonadetes bacterium]|nr:hypothetical protein [Gemmatimonadota bacterium]NIQ58313.1 hypothetical protein [Gemmatimonadota bacterium]NIU78529.1 hypothetical protein [Gammaproteobacteria bacterium]NIX47400.1 hypothetical protein [Gemmatimonadota bacterium]NIY11781.1 hypothetical protein [Gemmatimonadota bacterium]